MQLLVKYTVTLEQTVDWPDDELEDLSYENLLCNLDIDESLDLNETEISGIQKNGEEFHF